MIQQHDGVVVDVAGLVQGFAELPRERERGVAGEEGGAQGCNTTALPPPFIFAPWEGGGAGQEPIYMGGGGQGGDLPPKASWAPPTLGFPTLGAGGGPWGAPQPTKGWFPSHCSPWGPPG